MTLVMLKLMTVFHEYQRVYETATNTAFNALTLYGIARTSFKPSFKRNNFNSGSFFDFSTK